MTSVNDLRSSFVDYFARNGHEAVASSPLVPRNDPTLMFTNSGMVQFKNTFTGIEKRSYARATTAQKCVRAGGKHNDLDNVGFTARHHTFFEMLGNFSFGDYFKDRAIELAWNLLTKDWGLPKEKLMVTVYEDDDEALNLWKKIAGIGEDRIVRLGAKSNFWQMGDTGPCGPCSEIFYDHGEHVWGGPPGSPEEDGDRWIEIWNLVFMQYEQHGNGTRTGLPHPSIDTGMGLERVAAVMQGVHDNYDIDLFKSLIGAAAQATGTDTAGEGNRSLRVIADHLRSMSFLIAEGVLPSNEGRGYVLRRIMRRAMRHATLLGSNEPVIFKLVPTLVREMGQAYPELSRGEALISETVRLEEGRFLKTLGRGLQILADETSEMGEGAVLSGASAFKLYDTYGFPLDLTQDALRLRGITVDQPGFDAAMAAQKAEARKSWSGSGEAATDTVWYGLADKLGPTEFLGYETETAEGEVRALLKDGQEVPSLAAGDEGFVVLNQTPFYGESGGQVGDSGQLTSLKGLEGEVADTSKPLGRLHVLHTRVAKGEVSVGETLHQSVDEERRRATRANHSATHLLHAALRHRLGGHVNQKGSLVAPDRLRFDFSHPSALSADDIAAIEAEVNWHIRHNQPVTTRLMTPDEAIEQGAMALFGEKYGDEVRVLSMGMADARDYSVELCGGTHVSALGDIALFKIVSESAVSSGVRRIEALTGEGARQWLLARDQRLRDIAASLKAAPDEAPARVAALVETARRLERELAEAKRQLVLGGSGKADAAGPEDVAGIKFLGQVVEGLDPKSLRAEVDALKQQVGSGVGALIAVNEGRASVAVGITSDLADQISAVDLVKAAVTALGGQGGGGRPDMAQGGGPDGSKGKEALNAIKEALAKVNA